MNDTLIHLCGWLCVTYVSIEIFRLVLGALRKPVNSPAAGKVKAWDNKTGKPIEVEVINGYDVTYPHGSMESFDGGF